jgi:hypothetical protein
MKMNSIMAQLESTMVGRLPGNAQLRSFMVMDLLNPVLGETLATTRDDWQY